MFNADFLLIYLHDYTNCEGSLAISSPITDKNDILTPTLLYKRPLS